MVDAPDRQQAPALTQPSEPAASHESAPGFAIVPDDGINLRRWFVCYLAWLTALTGAAVWGLRAADATGSAAGLAVWVLAGYAFYLSICCTFFPAPTTWIVMLAASDLVAQQVGLQGYAPLRLFVVAALGAAATGMANLNEYHVWAYLLRKRRVSKIRQTRFFSAASTWFHASPFWILSLFSFLPIPVDVVRWLAITARYPRSRFFCASFLGRLFRYVVWALTSAGFQLGAKEIAIFQAALVAVALLRILPRLVRRIRTSRQARGAAP